MQVLPRGSFEIYDNFGTSGELIKKAATTCYRSEENSKTKSVDYFIELLKKNQHTAMLEFSWFVIQIVPKYIPSDQWLTELFSQIRKEKYLECALLEDNTILVAGNGRAWFELLQREVIAEDMQNVFNSIAFKLEKINPYLFNFKVSGFDLYNINTIEKKQLDDFYKSKKVTLEQYQKLNWFVVKFFDVSRGFTHEIVRHRVMSFAQMSTRYVPLKDFDFICDLKYIQSEEARKKLLNCLNEIQLTYNYIINCGYKRDIARNILPIGIEGEIVVAGNIEGWKHIFNLRTAKTAHYEIREICEELKEILEKKYNYIF